LTYDINKSLADTAHPSPRPIPLHRLDADALASSPNWDSWQSSRLGLQLNVSQAPGFAIAALARGDLKRGYARVKRTAA
jgi:hypothetical protein